MTQVDHQSQLPFHIAYLTSMLLQIFLPCFFGQMVRDAYDKLATSLYHCDWLTRKREFKKLMIIVMENFKRRVRISALTVFDVDLQTFSRIANSAFTLYAVLKSF